MAHLLNQAGNCEDVRNSIKCGWAEISSRALDKALKNELKNLNRSTVLKLLRKSLMKKWREEATAKAPAKKGARS